ncbi:NADH-quinone oxidoreductase subunit NuoN [Siculibacillus lacustris]|uniref:NADH-quinone oxidoreductase subunit N n=1 Tax=Siculibacillus lacustris TaxID=1549641 RepID=A0A4Q9VMW7_9HYPH|nr:NADH-quinone oxidoreductase subunit NuoN [Siculibacillus lacustris]TBW36949.1 NADH-quinone oxidoreductase subunit NuoN [Siculibacillus lacustris]
MTPDLLPALPEILLAIGALALLMYGVFVGEKSIGTVTWGAVLLLVAAAIAVLAGPKLATTFGGAWVIDPFARFMKVLALGGSAVAVVLAARPSVADRYARFEYPVLVVLATVGMMMMISAGDLISLYLGLELQSLALYVLAAIDRDNLKSTEAGLKYFVLGALSSGLLLYGASLTYGFTGHTGFTDIAAYVKAHGASTGVVFGLVFILAGLTFKISAVPFHMWTPDVYEGSPTPITAFFASAPKVAAFALVIRVTAEAFGPAGHSWQQIIAFVALASMVLGAFAGIGQKNIKRLMAYSSIGHMGYALVGLAAGTAEGVQGVAIYLAIYVVTTLGTFAMILAMRRDGHPVEEIGDLAGLSRSRPLVAAGFALLLFSLAGIPPLAGFFGKLYVFMAAVHAGLIPLAILGVIASVIGAYYYIRIVKVIYFDEPVAGLDPLSIEQSVVFGVASLFVLVFIVFGNGLVTAADAAAKSLF